MDHVESVFLDADPTIFRGSWPNADVANDKLKIGEIFQMADAALSIQCTRCQQEFQYFTEFSLHTQQHFLCGDIAPLAEVKNEPAEVNLSETPELEPEVIPTEDLIKVEDYHFEDHEENSNDFQDLTHFMDADADVYAESTHSMDAVDDNDQTIITPAKSPKLKKLPTEKVNFTEGKHYVRTKDSKYECLTCGRLSERWDHFKEHLLTHTSAKNVYCPICMKAFISVSYVRKHIARFHKKKITGAEIRQAQRTLDIPSAQSDPGSDKEEMGHSENRQPKEDKTVCCLECGKWFLLPRYVQKHMRFVHSKPLSMKFILENQPNRIGQTNKNSKSDSAEIKTEDHKPTLDSLDEGRKATGSENNLVKNYECFDCHKLFMNAYSLRKHLQLHRGTKFACPKCDKLFAQRSYVLDHLLVVHGIKRNLYIRSKIREITDVYETDMMSRTISNFECYLCKSSFHSKIRLRYHMKCHILGPLLCVFCGSIFKSRDTLRHHMERHKADPNSRSKCPHCDKTYPTKRYMQRHVRCVHTEKSKPVKTNYVKKMVSCDQCDKQFQGEHRLKQHMMTHNKRYYVCEVCGWEFKENSNLKKHMQTHTHENNKTNCNVCGKVLSIRYLVEHMKIHEGVKDYQCATCGAQFITRERLKKHNLRHTREMKYQCDLCAKGFLTSDKLLLHRRSHTEKMEHTCTTCNKGFFSIKSLRKHMNTHYLEQHPTI